MEAGFYRVFLASAVDDDSVVVYLPLDGEGKIAMRAVVPRLAKLRWEGNDYWGEYESRSKLAAFRWGNGETQLTTLGSKPIRKGTQCLIYASDHPEDESWVFVVRDMQRM